MVNPTIIRIGPQVTLPELTEFLKAAASSKTNELELVAAEALRLFMNPPMMFTGGDDDQ